MSIQAIVSFVICVLLPSLCGLVLVARFTTVRERFSLYAAGVVAGISIFITVAFLLTSVLTLGNAIVVADFVMLFFGGLYVKSPGSLRREIHTDPVLFRCFPVLAFLVFLLCARILLVSDGILKTGHLNCYGDLPLHVGLITNFVEGQQFPPESPILSGTQLVYPFLSDFYSALLIEAGMTLEGALEVPAMLFIMCGFLLFYQLVFSLSESRAAAFIAVLLFLFHGGFLGFLRFDNLSTSTLLKRILLADLPYFAGSAGDPQHYYLPNPLLAYFIPQRSFLFGFSLSMLILLLYRKVRTAGSAFFCGVLIGIVPLFHAHSALAIALPLIYFTFSLNFRLFLILLAAALPIGSAEVLYYASQSAAGNHIAIDPGWMVGQESMLWFWFKNTGLIIPIVFVALFVKRISRDVKSLAVVGYAIFVLCSVFLFARWKWDNTKLLIYAFIFFYPIVGVVLARLYDKFQWRPLVLLFIFFHSLSSVMDLVRYTATRGKTYTLWDKLAIDAAAEIARKIPAGESILSAPIHNSITLLAGRRMYLGFPGMIWTHGGDFYARDKAIPRFYQGKNRNLPGDSDLQYVLVGPVERKRYAPLFIDPSWEKVVQTNRVAVYRIRK